MKIRSSKLADIEEYTDLLQTTYVSAYVNHGIGLTDDCFSKEIFASDETQEYLKSHLLDTDQQKTWLACEDDRLVGAITAIIMSDVEAELTGYYVHPDCQGQGIGKKLYKKVVDFAGKRDLILDIYVHNTKTISMYKKWGWELDTTRGENGYFYRHWPEWPEGLHAKCMYMRKKRK
jgi:ribosomal protein S18 acetylase RimI-like enzyme